MKWRICRLGDVLTLKRGHDLPEQWRREGDVPVVTSSGITGFHNEAKAQALGVVTGRYGTLGEVFYLEQDYWPHNTALYVVDFKGTHPRFASYFLTNVLRDYQSDKAAVPGVDRNVLHEIKVRLPDEKSQVTIAETLQNYDELMENNRRRMGLLEEAGRLLYREWFVRLRFPGHEHAPITNGIPQGWRKVTLGSMTTKIGSGATPRGGEAAYLSEGITLIRSLNVMHVEPDDQDAFDRDFWRPLENRFHDNLGNFNSAEFSGFFRVFLQRGGRYVKEDATFETFEERYEAAGFSPVDLAKELTTFANYYDIICGRSPDDAPDVEKALAHLRSLESSTTHSLLLNLFHRRAKGTLTNVDLAKSVKMLSGFIMRRFICGESSRGYGRQFVKACDSLTANTVQSLYVFLESKGWPDALQFESAFRTFNLYERSYGRFILESLEAAHDHREPADTSAAEIEHVMPQTLSVAWKKDLGADAERIHGEWLHTPGNLTLSAYNRELWNYPFAEKREQYAQSNIVITRKLSESANWGEDEIRARGQTLAELAKKVWSGPAGIDLNEFD